MISIKSVRGYLTTAAFLLLPVMAITPKPAMADHRDDRREEMEMRRREQERHRWEMEHPIHHEIIAPAPVVYVPPPPSPGISIVLPVKIF